MFFEVLIKYKMQALGFLCLLIIQQSHSQNTSRADNPNTNLKAKSDPWIGKKLPEFNFTDINGNTVSSASLKGRPMVINIWGTTCMACLKEIPDLNKIKKDYAGSDIAFLALTRNPKEKVLAIMDKIQFDYTIISNAKKLTDTLTTALPLTVFADREGIIILVVDNVISEPRYKMQIINALNKMSLRN